MRCVEDIKVPTIIFYYFKVNYLRRIERLSLKSKFLPPPVFQIGNKTVYRDAEEKMHSNKTNHVCMAIVVTLIVLHGVRICRERLIRFCYMLFCPVKILRHHPDVLAL